MEGVGGVPPPLQRHEVARRTHRTPLQRRELPCPTFGTSSAASCYWAQTCEGGMHHRTAPGRADELGRGDRQAGRAGCPAAAPGEALTLL